METSLLVRSATTVCLPPASPPRDLELIDGPLAVVVIDKVLVTDTDALLLGSDAPLGKVTDDAVQQVVNIRHCFPRSEGNVHLAVMLKQLGLAVRALKAQRVKEGTLVRCDGHLLLVDTDLQLGKPCLFLHGPQFGNLYNALQIL